MLLEKRSEWKLAPRDSRRFQRGLREAEGDLYTPDWYRAIAPGSKRSAELFVPRLVTMLAPASVVDIGCGTGEWLAEFAAAGVPRILGVDGEWVPRAELAIPVDAFLALELREPLPRLGSRFDLALCLEVAEHLPPSRGWSLIQELTQLSDAVFFSAATPGQGGEGHINERPHGYWDALFGERAFQIRWTAEDLEASGAEWWYARNARLYVKAGTQPSGRIQDLSAVKGVGHDVSGPEFRQ